MNRNITEKFYTLMVQGDGANYKTAMSLKSLLDDLICYRQDKLREMFSVIPEPFKAVDIGNY